MQIIGGKYKKRHLVGPYGEQTRPTTSMLRETVFNICQHSIDGATFLDIFAGSGAMGLEALSRGASHATFIEKSKLALRALKENISFLQGQNCTEIYPIDVLLALKKLHKKERFFDIIYIDPPYGKDWSSTVLKFIDTYSLLNKGGVLLIEDTSFAFTPQTLSLKSERKVGRAILKEFQPL